MPPFSPHRQTAPENLHAGKYAYEILFNTQLRQRTWYKISK